MEHPIDLIREAAARGARTRSAPRGRAGRVTPPARWRRGLWPSVGEWRLVLLGGVMLGMIASIVEWPAVTGPTAAGLARGDGGEAGVTRRFGFCHIGGGVNCVVDGDTFWIDGAKVRIADIDTPETHPARCDEEARLGAAATERLQTLLNAGPVVLRGIERDTDRYGRKLRLVEAGGVEVGAALVNAGLARPYAGGRRAGGVGWGDAGSPLT